MKLEFVYIPVHDLTAALALYRDALGWTRRGERATRRSVSSSPEPRSN